MSVWTDTQDPPWTGTTLRRVRSGNNKDKMTALEEAYDNLKQKTPDVCGTRRVTKLEIIRAASLNTDSLEEQLKQALASQPGLAPAVPTGDQTAGALPTQLPCPMPIWKIPTKVQGRLWTPPEARQPGPAWRWPPTLEWPVQVWEDPLPATATGSPTASATQARTLTGGDKTREDRQGKIRVSPWLIQANPQAGHSQPPPMDGSPARPFVIEDDPTRSDFRTWPTITLTEEQSPEGKTASVRESGRVLHDVEYRDAKTGEEITEPKRLERLKKRYKGRNPLLFHGKKKKDESDKKKTETDPLSESVKLKPNCLLLSDQLQKVVNRMKVDKKTGGNAGLSLSAQLQGVFSQMRAEEAISKEDSNPRRVQTIPKGPRGLQPPKPVGD